MESNMYEDLFLTSATSALKEHTTRRHNFLIATFSNGHKWHSVNHEWAFDEIPETVKLNNFTFFFLFVDNSLIKSIMSSQKKLSQINSEN